MGSLVAAVASYLRARQADGQWLLRIEDIDPPREVKGASDSFLTTLELFGFEWDGDVTYQSKRFDLYRDALEKLKASNSVYRCKCSRREIERAIRYRSGRNGVYPGTCVESAPDQSAVVNWRFATQDSQVTFTDLLQGEQTIRFGKTKRHGDFIVWRKDDLPIYQLAVSVDDIAQGITEVVRGIDLLHETAGQILIRNQLTGDDTATQSSWMHVPTVTNAKGDKLSKQTGAAPLDNENVAQQLCHALKLLGLPVEPALSRAAVREIWAFAFEHWQSNNLFNIQIATLD